jgi:hypothetical protein
MAPNPHPGSDYYVDTINGSIQRGYMAAQIRFAGHPILGPFDWAHATQNANRSWLGKGEGAAKGAASELKKAASWTQAVGRVFASLGDWHLWASLGWIVLGVALMLIGLRLWIGKLTPPGTPGPLGMV